MFWLWIAIAFVAGGAIAWCGASYVFMRAIGGPHVVERLPTERKTVLVIDDDAPTRRGFKRQLEGAGFDVVEAENGADGLRDFDARRVAAIVSDVNMPRVPGTEVLRSIRKTDAAIPVLMVSANMTDEMRAQLDGDGATMCLDKIDAHAELLGVVRRYAGSRSNV